MLNTLTRLTLFIVFFTVALMSHFGFATEDGIDIFLKTIDSQQNISVIFSGKVSYELTKRLASKTEEEIHAECEQMIADFKQTFPDHPMTETIISNIHEAVETKYSQNQIFSGTFLFDYSQKDYQYIENQLIDENSKMPVTVIEKRALHQKTPHSEVAMLDPSISQVIINNAASSVADFSQFGRLRGILTSLMIGVIKDKDEVIAKNEIKKHITEVYGNNKDTTVLEIVETKPFDNGSTSYTIESAVNGKVTQRYIIVPSLGYICPKIEFFDLASGNLIEQYEAKDFVLHQRTGLYYPTYYIESRYNGSSGKLVEKREYKIDQNALSLNETMSPKDFSLDIPEGLKVLDARDGKNVEFIADESGILSLVSDGFDLKKMSWLRKTGGLPNNDSEKQHYLVRITLMMIGLSLIVWALIKRRQNRTIFNRR